MPASFKMIPSHGVCYVRFSGVVKMSEVVECFEAFAAHPQSQTLRKHLVDFSTVTSYDNDVVKILAFQAQTADVFATEAHQWIFAYYAPTSVSREMANFGLRAWSATEGIALRMCATEDAVLDVLGLTLPSLSALLAEANESAPEISEPKTNQ